MCCGAGRTAGRIASNSYLIGEEDNVPARFVRIISPEIIPNKTGTAWVRGSMVQSAIDDGLLEDASKRRNPPMKTVFIVTSRGGEVERFDSYQAARVTASRNAGRISVSKEPFESEE